MGAEYLSYVKSIAPFAPTFYGYIISVLASVACTLYSIYESFLSFETWYIPPFEVKSIKMKYILCFYALLIFAVKACPSSKRNDNPIYPMRSDRNQSGMYNQEPLSSLKVSKSRKQIITSLILPKKEQITLRIKNEQNTLRILFRVRFIHFLEESRTSLFAFEIYWPVVVISIIKDLYNQRSLVYRVCQLNMLHFEVPDGQHKLTWFFLKW